MVNRTDTVIVMILTVINLGSLVFQLSTWGYRSPVQLVSYKPTNEKISITLRQGSHEWTEEWVARGDRIIMADSSNE